MDLLPDELKARLPPFSAMDDMSEPYISIHYSLPETEVSWWVVAGQPYGRNDFLFFGFVSGLNRFRYFRLGAMLLDSSRQCLM